MDHFDRLKALVDVSQLKFGHTQLLMPLKVTPSITNFCATRKIRMTGRTAMLMAAITTERLPDCPDALMFWKPPSRQNQ
jgi:hypothetical protein